ncbi:TetR/AcrR family transcriptional regulator [Streptantibioticus cattleyicolor]|uniref:Transcriptional regulator, TetR family n=1 Tax=Streptantibioticus cattleyicolor (strain ATCC 35852 / DSM 46488 / JCM 4925 / NBRC 14057 / NRRL 8057) TaxID=1003195 RepID=F8JK88_STREN|nr:TetR/AcrR family transcriptional regulator [Streptantibioticus cattleyicolor]AEW98550.1 transcriptional regulator, TetR family [Streptantibioticus cattleyicolor NRRL 8057 = DSM 46488]CCB72391.1 Transcriptional regulator, TetR family [Streptantibioticus cattleyicolor NRRL 8057 = DSM 46488]
MTRTEERPGGRRLLPRDERRAQLIRAAATAFARQGFAATGLEDVAREAGVTRAIIYRHFASKTVLYQAVLDDTQERLRARLGPPDRYDEGTVRALVEAACDDPDGFRMLFRHAQREPEFAAHAEERSRAAARTAERHLRDVLPDPGHRRWVAGLIPALTIELVLSWLDAGRPVGEDDLVRTIRATSRALARRG